MIKRLFTINQFVLGFIIIGLITSGIYFNANKHNKYFLKTVENTYEISFVNNTYIVSSFSGSGGWLYGGLISNSKISDINKISKKELELIIENNSEYSFPIKSFPDSGFLYIGNYDFDKNIEIFAFDLVGTSFIKPIEINKNGQIKNENIFIQAKLLFLASFWMLPNFIFYFIFIIQYFIVCIIFGIFLLINKRKKIT